MIEVLISDGQDPETLRLKFVVGILFISGIIGAIIGYNLYYTVIKWVTK